MIKKRRNSHRLTPVAALLLSAGAMVGTAHAGTIDSFDDTNIEDTPTAVEDFAEVYQDITTDPPSDTNGFIDFGSTDYPGVEVYQETFSSGGTDFVGCVMSKLDATDDAGTPIPENCTAASDSSKRIKVNATETSTAPTLPTADGVDLIFNAADGDPEQLYRWFGKLGNQTDGRLTGFKVELGTGVGGSFTLSSGDDGLGVDTVSSPFGNFPGGLFGGSQTSDTPFFSDQDADFIPTASIEDRIEATTVPDTYTATFGNWLPLKWVPLAWFFDDDGNPDTDDIIQAWFDGEKWTDGAGNLIPASDLATWEDTPPTVEESDGTLYATWDYENEVYVLADGSGTVTLEEMNNDEDVGIPTNQRERVPGYSMGAVDDLAKININFQIGVENPGLSQFTVRLTPIVSDDASDPPAWVDPATDAPYDPITSDDQPNGTDDGDDGTDNDDDTLTFGGGGSGCTMGGNRAFDPLLPGMILLALGYLALRRRWNAAL